jgi:hypothetical protein
MSATNTNRTVVQNISGVTRTFAFLRAPYGKRLEADEQHSEPGDLRQRLLNYDNENLFSSFEKALEAGHIAIISSPAQHLYDAVQGETKVVKLVDGTLSADDPSWGSYSSQA